MHPDLSELTQLVNPGSQVSGGKRLVGHQSFQSTLGLSDPLLGFRGNGAPMWPKIAGRKLNVYGI